MESEYTVLESNKDYEKRKEYWEIAKGLQQVDRLDTSEYLDSVIEDTVTGKYDTTVLPAHAGMIPRSTPTRSRGTRAPRACGDDPVTLPIAIPPSTCSPRMRG